MKLTKKRRLPNNNIQSFGCNDACLIACDNAGGYNPIWHQSYCGGVQCPTNAK